MTIAVDIGRKATKTNKAKEQGNPDKRNREWVKRLSAVIKALNAERKKAPPIVTKKADAPICPYANVRYLYQPGELEGDG